MQTTAERIFESPNPDEDARKQPLVLVEWVGEMIRYLFDDESALLRVGHGWSIRPKGCEAACGCYCTCSLKLAVLEHYMDMEIYRDLLLNLPINATPAVRWCAYEYTVGHEKACEIEEAAGCRVVI
jgi:hypothetical protein